MKTLNSGKSTDETEPIRGTHIFQVWADDDLMDTEIVMEVFAVENVLYAHLWIVEEGATGEL